MKEKERKIIEKFISKYYLDYREESSPEEENRSSPACEVIYSNGRRNKIAIEHCSIDSYENQRREEERFKKYGKKIERELEGQFPGLLRIDFPLRPYQPGKDWNEITTLIIKALQKKVPEIDFQDKLSKSVKIQIKNISFPLYINRTRYDDGVVLVRRFGPELYREKLPSLMLKRLPNKIESLRPYFQDKRVDTILLLETFDPALMNDVIFRKAYNQVKIEIDGIEKVDHKFHVDTTLSDPRFIKLE